MFTRRLLPLLPLLASGCVATAVYGTPRPLAPGAVQVSILIEQVANGDAILAPDRNQELLISPVPGPGVETRVGLSSGLDLGARLSMASGLAADLKIGLVEREHVALALNPAIGSGFYVNAADDDPTAQLAMRLLASWRSTPTFELVGHVTAGLLRDANGPGVDAVGTWGGGLGPLFRLTPGVGLQPSATILWRSDRASWHPELAMGIGITLGRERP